MEELIHALDPQLSYEFHEFKTDHLDITVSSNRSHARCPYCGQFSSRIHSVYPKSFQDLPVQGHKVTIHLMNRKFFCVNPACDHKTFSERFDCIADNAKRTKRLEQEIINLAIHCSSVTAAKLLRVNTTEISKSTICDLLHKERLRSISH